MQSAQQTYARLGLPAPDDATAAHWDAVLREAPAGPPAFFQESYVRECCRTLAMRPDAEAALAEAALALSANADAVRLARYVRQRNDYKEFPTSPADGLECPGGNLFWALLFLAKLPEIRAFHRSRGVSDAISRDTLSDLELWIHEHRRLTGTWGLRGPWWIANHFHGRIYKLGRLQFEQHIFHGEVTAYRNAATRQVVVFAGAGEFRADGQYASADGGSEPAAFSTTFSDDGAVVRGHPISPHGFVLRDGIELRASEWVRIFAQGDPVLGIHIPATGPMEHAACGESLRGAVEFYRTHFPERPFKALTCSSWLLDPQFEGMLPASSNIVRFLAEFYLYPLPKANEKQTYERVFDDENVDIRSAPRKSTLQRAIVEHVLKGGRWRGGGAIYFPEDLAWGERVYRRRTAGILPAS